MTIQRYKILIAVHEYFVRIIYLQHFPNIAVAAVLQLENRLAKTEKYIYIIYIIYNIYNYSTFLRS